VLARVYSYRGALPILVYTASLYNLLSPIPDRHSKVGVFMATIVIATGVLVGLCLLILCGLIANLFFYSHGLFRAERLQRQRDKQAWNDLWSHPSDTDRLLQ
jgi:hypothetical protein